MPEQKKAILYTHEGKLFVLFPQGITDKEIKNIVLGMATGFSFPIPPQHPEDFGVGGTSAPTQTEIRGEYL